jgi:uncharacterized phage protein gp47/JayE
MGLTLKSFQEILKGMADWTIQNSNRLIDFSQGSAIRTLYEAVATEIEEFYFRVYKNFQWAVENSLYESFDFQRRSAIAAYGDITITFSNPLPSDLVIPTGTRFATNSGTQQIQFETKEVYNVFAGSTEATITVYCTEAGTVGNVAANTITVMMNPISYVSAVTNPKKFLTGKDEETLAERKARFKEYVNTRSRGTKRALEYGALEIPEIAGVYVDDSEVGIVTVYAHDQAGNLSDTLKTQVKNNLENYRPAGIPVIVLPTVKVTPDVTVELTVEPSYDNPSFVQYVKESIEDYLNSFLSSEDLLRSSLNAYIRSLDKGILNCHILQPTADIPIENNQIIRSGTITVTTKREG